MTTTDSKPDVLRLERPPGLSDEAWATLKADVVTYLDAACDQLSERRAAKDHDLVMLGRDIERQELGLPNRGYSSWFEGLDTDDQKAV